MPDPDTHPLRQDDPAPLRLDVDDRPDALVLVVGGQIDNTTVDSRRKAMDRAVADLGDRHLVRDLAHVEFFGSAGIAVLVEALSGVWATAGSQQPFRGVVDDTRPVLRPIRPSGPEPHLRLYSDLADALSGPGVLRPRRRGRRSRTTTRVGRYGKRSISSPRR